MSETTARGTGGPAQSWPLPAPVDSSEAEQGTVLRPRSQASDPSQPLPDPFARARALPSRLLPPPPAETPPAARPHRPASADPAPAPINRDTRLRRADPSEANGRESRHSVMAMIVIGIAIAVALLVVFFGVMMLQGGFRI